MESFSMRCFAHILNLKVNEDSKDSNDFISSICNAMRFVRSSPQTMAKFKECIEFTRISSNKLVSLDVSTRWNSIYIIQESAGKFEATYKQLKFEGV